MEGLGRQPSDGILFGGCHPGSGKMGGVRVLVVEDQRDLADDKVALPEGERPFAHPAFWAAFTLLGDPD